MELALLRWLFGIALSVVVAAVVAGGVVWYFERPTSYNECIVSEMRGLPAAAMYTVERVCAVRFRKEDELPLSVLGKSLEVQMLPDFDKDPGVVMAGSKNWDDPPWVFTIRKNETYYRSHSHTDKVFAQMDS